MENRRLPYVYVQDTLNAMILAYEKPEAEGRYICSAFTLSAKEMVEKLKSMYPDYVYPTRYYELSDIICYEEYSHFYQIVSTNRNLKCYS